MSVTAILLAAGASSRMRGADKMLQPVRGTTLLRDRAEACLTAGVDAVRVVLPPNTPERYDTLNGLNIEVFETAKGLQNMSHSIETGMRGIHTDAVLLMLADLPDLTAAHLSRVITAARAHPTKTIIRGATQTGKPGHPVLIRRTLFDELENLEGDVGAQPLLRRHGNDTALVQLGDAALADLDTPEAWTAWRAAQQL